MNCGLYTLNTYAFRALTLLVRRHERHLLCKKFCHRQCSWLIMTAWWQHAVSRSGTLLLSLEIFSLEVRAVFVTHQWQHTGTLSSFSALMLLVGWQEGHPTCKRHCDYNSQKFSLLLVHCMALCRLAVYLKVKKVLPKPEAHGAALISVSLALSQTPAYTARPRILPSFC